MWEKWVVAALLLPTRSPALRVGRSAGLGSAGDLREFLLELENLTYTCRNATRVGGPHDGGYVVCEDAPWRAAGGCVLLGYGIGRRDGFEAEVSDKWGCAVQEFDPTVGTSPGSKAHPSMIHFHREGVSGAPGVLPIGKVDSLERQLDRFGPTPGRGEELLVKMDVEGAEWSVLNSTPDSVLGRVDQLVMELHLYGEDGPYGTLGGATALLRRLKSLFYLYEVHFNNCHVCRRPLPGAEGYFVPAAVELSLVRKTRIHGTPRGPFRGHAELERSNIRVEPPLGFASFPIPPA